MQKLIITNVKTKKTHKRLSLELRGFQGFFSRHVAENAHPYMMMWHSPLLVCMYVYRSQSNRTEKLLLGLNKMPTQFGSI